MFQTIRHISFLDFNSGSYEIPKKIQTKSKKGPNDKPDSLKYVRHIVKKYKKKTAILSDSQQCLSIQQYNSMSWLIQKFHILISVLFLL